MYPINATAVTLLNRTRSHGVQTGDNAWPPRPDRVAVSIFVTIIVSLANSPCSGARISWLNKSNVPLCCGTMRSAVLPPASLSFFVKTADMRLNGNSNANCSHIIAAVGSVDLRIMDQRIPSFTALYISTLPKVNIEPQSYN